jgi:hypothetical protein
VKPHGSRTESVFIGQLLDHVIESVSVQNGVETAKFMKNKVKIRWFSPVDGTEGEYKYDPNTFSTVDPPIYLAT